MAEPTSVDRACGDMSLIADAVRDDHFEFERMIARLRGLSDAAPHGWPADRDPAVLIEEFEDLVLLHFAAEEAEEFVGSLVTDQPRLLGRVERLQREHGELATALDDLLELARGKPRATELAARVEGFLARLDAHEHAENALMQELIVLDEGGGG
jgi:hypothetical protein